MAEATVRDRLALLEEYQQLAPEYLKLVDIEQEALKERVAVEERLRSIVDQIGKDPAGVLPRRRRTKREAEAGKNGSGKAKAKPEEKAKDEPPELPAE